MSEILTGKMRSKTGKGASRVARREGGLPSVLYGQQANLFFTINPRELSKIIKHKGHNAIIELAIDGDSVKKRNVLIKDYQTHPLKEGWVHADFLEIDLNKSIRVHVPVKLTGTSQGEKMGGILNHILRQLTVDCLPALIPDHIEVSIEGLAIGQVVHVSDLKVSEKMRIVNPPSAAIVSVTVEKEKKEKPAAEGAAAEGAAAEGAAAPAADAKGAAASAADAKGGKGAPAADAGKAAKPGKK